MKNVLKFIVERISGANLHADQTMIKGQKSGGVRDANGKDWYKNEGGNNRTS